MARLARLVIPGTPYHVTQRGNRRGTTFFEDGDFAVYRGLLAEAARKADASVWSYCLMPNHVHVIIVPGDADSLRGTFANAHRRYAGFINARHRWTGHLWQGRFGAVAMDEAHLIHAARYVALNPVRARLCDHAEQWPWSSAVAHLTEADDELVQVKPLLDGSATSPLFSASPRISRRRAPCGWPKPPAARWAQRTGLLSSNRRPAEPSLPANAAPSQDGREFRVFR